MTAARQLAAGFALAALLALVGAGTAAATPGTPVTISNTVSFVEGAVDPFTSTGGVVCAAGTVSTPFAVFVGWQSGSKAQILVGKHFVCPDGTFELLLRVTLDFATGDTAGTWSVVSGTGAYDELHGTGRIVGDAFEGGIQDEYAGAMHLD
jgi:hypothetical protein